MNHPVSLPFPPPSYTRPAPARHPARRLCHILFLALAFIALSEMRVQAETGQLWAVGRAPQGAAPESATSGAAPSVAPATRLAHRATAIHLAGLAASSPGLAVSPRDTVRAAADALPLRARPAAAGAVIATAPQGTTLTVRAALADGSWLQVAWGEEMGWVDARLVAR